MQIRAYQPLSFHEKGRRHRNEDNIYPTSGQATDKSTVFLVCDGVGGAVNGDIASRMVSDAFGRAFETKKADNKSLQKTLTQVQQQIDNFLKQNPNSEGMGTTLTFLQFHTDGATIAHAGDSRVYHIRGNTVLFSTSDHSLVNDLRKKGLLEEAENAKSNIITRALQGDSVRKISLDAHIVTDIEADDYFLLCSDGVWGAISDADLTAILHKDKTNAEKLKELELLCEQFSKDNYSAYLIQIQKVENGATSTLNKPLVVENTPTRIFVESTQKARNAAWVTPLLITALLVGIGFAFWYGWSNAKKDKQQELNLSATPQTHVDNDSISTLEIITPPSVKTAKTGEKEAVKTGKKEATKETQIEKKVKKEAKNTKYSTAMPKPKPAAKDTTKKKVPLIEIELNMSDPKVDTLEN